MEWHESVLQALRRFSCRHGTRKITRQDLISEELPTILEETRSEGITPEQNLSRYLQILRDQGLLCFRDGSGTYFLLDTPLDAEAEEFSDEVLDYALEWNKLRLGAVSTSSREALTRLRRGQDRLRILTLRNYGGKCALCDVIDEQLLVASHISRWADDPEVRGNLSNVICLCRSHDALFEVGYLSLSDDLKVLRKNDGGSKTIALNLTLAKDFRQPLAHPPAPVFLQKHRKRT
jgi:hypothetical protein